MESIITFLSFFGATPGNSPFLVLGALMVGLTLWQNAKLNAFEKRIEVTLGKIKTNIKVIVTFLATVYPDRFDVSLIEGMSPLRIKEGGYDILNRSGFAAIMKNREFRNKILSYVAEENPASKLDVQNYAIIYFPTILEEDFMLPIKAYLYNFPKDGEMFSRLAGLYIRDEYLKDHLDITQ